MKFLTATITKAPRQVTTKFGELVVCDVKLEDGSESAIWGPKDYALLLYLKAGQAVTVSKDSKGKIAIIENHLTHPEMVAPAFSDTVSVINPEPNQSQYQGMSNETKKQVASYVTEMANLFNFCLKQVDQTVENITQDDRRAIATSLFISAQKKYSL